MRSMRGRLDAVILGISCIILLSLLLNTAWAAFPPVPSSAVHQTITNAKGEQATYYMWSEDGTLYLHVELNGSQFSMPGYFIVVQNGYQYQSVFIQQENGDHYPTPFFISMTLCLFSILPNFDASLPLTLVYRFSSTQTYFWDIVPLGPGSTDLIVNRVSGPATGTIGKTITFTNSVKNIGTVNAKPFLVGLYLSKDKIVDPVKDRLLGGRSLTTGLAAGRSSKKVSLVAIPNDIPPGLYYIGAFVDLTKSVEEANEANNYKCSTTQIQIQ